MCTAYLYSFCILVFLTQPLFADTLDGVIRQAPTSTVSTQLRGGAGVYNAPRANGKQHAGVDIVANQSSSNKEAYRVMAAGDGVVAYAHLNGSPTNGYGYTIVIDHGNGYYTLYGHLNQQASEGLVKPRDPVSAGKVIGYMADLPACGTGNSENLPPYLRIQLHLEVISAPSGRVPASSIGQIKDGGWTVDPTPRLKVLGYVSP